MDFLLRFPVFQSLVQLVRVLPRSLLDRLDDGDQLLVPTEVIRTHPHSFPGAVVGDKDLGVDELPAPDVPLHDFDVLVHRPRSTVDLGGVVVSPATGDQSLFAQAHDVVAQRADGSFLHAWEVGLELRGRDLLHELVYQPCVFIGRPIQRPLRTAGVLASLDLLLIIARGL